MSYFIFFSECAPVPCDVKVNKKIATETVTELKNLANELREFLLTRKKKMFSPLSRSQYSVLFNGRDISSDSQMSNKT